jgi:hypothetical protein
VLVALAHQTQQTALMAIFLSSVRFNPLAVDMGGVGNMMLVELVETEVLEAGQQAVAQVHFLVEQAIHQTHLHHKEIMEEIAV